MSGNRLIILAHGLGGSGDIDKLKPYLKQTNTTILDLHYGWFGVLKAALFNGVVASRLARMLEGAFNLHQYDSIVYIAHSNGCTIGHLASFKLDKPVGGPFEDSVLTYVYIAPALGIKDVPSEVVSKVIVLHSKSDKVLQKAGWARRVFNLFRISPKSLPYGEMGRVGATEDDGRVVNLDFYKHDFGHGDYFSTPFNRMLVSDIIEDHLKHLPHYF